MGFLTTITYSNDAGDAFDKNPERMSEILHDAITGAKLHENNNRSYSEHVGGYCNYVHVQRTRHADDHTMYVHMGNGVTEMNPWSEDTKKILHDSPDYFNTLISYMEGNVKQLKKMRTEHLARLHNTTPEGLDALRIKVKGMFNELPDAKIHKIKEIRASTGYSLKEAIEFLESL